jgi:hypothetical protein
MSPTALHMHLPTSGIVIAQAARPQPAVPIRIVTGEPEPLPKDWTAVAALAGSTLILIVLCAVIVRFARRRRTTRPPEDIAFTSLARRMGLRGPDRELVQEIALKASIQSPVAVLVSRGAFDQVMLTALGRGAPAESVRRVRRLGQKLRWLTEEEVTAPVEPPEPQPSATLKAARRVPANPTTGKAPVGQAVAVKPTAKPVTKPAAPQSVPRRGRGGPGQR